MHDTLSPRRLRALIALAWLVAGALLLLLTPLSGHSDTLGWTPAFWLLLAPTSVLVAMKPNLPLSLLSALWEPLQRRSRVGGRGHLGGYRR